MFFFVLKKKNYKKDEEKKLHKKIYWFPITTSHQGGVPKATRAHNTEVPCDSIEKADTTLVRI